MNHSKPNPQTFHKRLRYLMNLLVHKVYDLTDNFPKKEVFGLASQLRRASLSVVLNYIEGYARFRKAINKNFLEISYGSLQETKYLIKFSSERNYLTSDQFDEVESYCEEIGRMLWSTLRKIPNKKGIVTCYMTHVSCFTIANSKTALYHLEIV